ncbi:MAG: GNAT family N-acetyltransferase [Clostridiaceae bacterium]|nr:GNAT family N-acetyltransferase [Clostridiaceae bacterium]
MTDLPVLHTQRLLLRLLNETAAPAVLDYYRRNRQFHQPWFANRPDSVFTLRQQQLNLAAEWAEFQSGRAVPFWLSPVDHPDRVIGRMAFTQIVRGCFHSSFLAYHLDQDYQGRGLACEAGQAAIPRLFEDFGLHRIEANIMPANRKSIALAERLGFELEGLSIRYLQINGVWQDHLHYVRLSDGPLKDSGQPANVRGVLSTGALLLRPLTMADIPAATAYTLRNLDYLSAWNPVADNLTQDAGWLEKIARSERDEAAGTAVLRGLFLPDRPDYLAGTVECRDIQSLPFSCGEIGYAIDSLLAGRGLMIDAMAVFIRYLFGCYGMNRLTARVCEGNNRSLQLLSVLGFQQEGYEKKAIYLHDAWLDRRLLVLPRSLFPVL